jgi:hypothetical protein
MLVQDGSIVNWLNGPLFQLVGEHMGFHVGRERLHAAAAS